MPGKRYSKEEKQEMLKTIRGVYESGGSIQKAGQAAGVSHQTARIWLKEAGVKLREAKGRNEIGYDPETLKELAEEGLTEKEIAERLHASGSTVRMWLKAEGIKINLEARKEREEKEKASGLNEKKEQKKKCRTCMYRSTNPNYGCNYEGNTGKCRLPICGIIGCTVYKKGRPLRSRKKRPA